jgi:uncharacterized protein YdiU (UPF0061 family)
MSIYSAIYNLNDDEYRKILDAMTYDGYLINMDVIDDVQDDMEAKCVKLAKLVQAISSDLETINNELKRLRDLKSAHEANLTQLKDYILFSMMTLDVKAIDAKYLTLIRRRNPPKVIIDEEAKLPPEYVRMETVFNKVIKKEEISKDLKAGKDVRGAHLDYGESLMIK